MRIAQISDLHFTHTSWNPFQLCSKRIVGTLNWLLFRKKITSFDPLFTLPSLFKKLNVDLILCAGDLTSTSLTEEFEMARNFWNRFNLPKIIIPGNHDQYTKRAHRQKLFYQYFQNSQPNIQHPLQFFTLENHGIEVHRLQPSWWCIALDTAVPNSFLLSSGLFSETLEQYLKEALGSIPSEDQILILNHFPFFENDEPSHHLLRGSALRSLLEKHPNVRFYLHGHSHRHTIADLRANHLPIILDGGCIVRKLQWTWNLIDWTDNDFSVHAYQWNGQEWNVFREELF